LEKSSSPRENTLWAAILLAAMVVLFYMDHIAFPGSLYARVVREFWPLYHTWPHYELSKRIFAEGHFPLWNPLNAFGAPMLGCFQAASFHPARIVLYFFPFWKAIDIWLLLRVFLSGLGVYWFLRWRGSSWRGAVFAACAWMFCGSITDYVNLHYLDIDLLLPYGLLAFGWMVRGGGAASVLASVSVVSVAFLGGNPTSILFLLIFLTAYYFYTAYRLREDLPGAWVRFGATAFLIGLCSAMVILPFREMLAFSWDYHIAGLWSISLEPQYILSIFGPEVFPPYDSVEMPLLYREPYIGTVVLVVALPGLFYLRKMGSGASFFSGFALFFIGVIWGVPPFNLFNYLPLFARTSNFRYAMPELTFCVALLAGMSWDHLTHYRERPLYFIILPFVLTVTASVLVSLKHLGNLDFHVSGPGLLMLCAFAWAASLVCMLQSRIAAGKAIVFFLLLFLWLFEASLHFRYLEPLSTKGPAEWRNPVPVEVDLPKGERIYARDGLLYPNLNMVAGTEDIRYFGALYVRRYRQFMSMVNRQSDVEEINDFIPFNFIRVLPSKLESELLDLVGLKTILSVTPLPPNRLVDRSVLRGEVIAPDENHVLKRKMRIGSEIRTALYQHPPSMITLSIPRGDLSFGTGIDPSRWELGGDGAGFMIISNGPDGKHCVFSRHIDPGNNLMDRWWLDYTVEDVGPRLSFITLPGGNSDGDWSAWGELRSTGLEGETRYGLVADGDAGIYGNSTAMPRAFMVENAFVGGAEGCIEDLDGGFDFRRTACLEGLTAHEARVGIKYSDDTRIETERAAHDKTVVKVNAPHRSLLVLTETYYPGWTAFLEDGTELAIYPADGVFRAVAAPAGEHTVTFIYRPATFRIGLWTTLVSSLVAILVFSRRKKEED